MCGNRIIHKGKVQFTVLNTVYTDRVITQSGCTVLLFFMLLINNTDIA